MKVKTWVECSQEVEVDVSREDIIAAFVDGLEAAPRGDDWLRLINRFAMILKTLPDTQIAQWTPEARTTIAQFLRDQLPRFTG